VFGGLAIPPGICNGALVGNKKPPPILPLALGCERLQILEFSKRYSSKGEQKVVWLYASNQFSSSTSETTTLTVSFVGRLHLT
jgi:hypothetical protein